MKVYTGRRFRYMEVGRPSASILDPLLIMLSRGGQLKMTVFVNTINGCGYSKMPASVNRLTEVATFIFSTSINGLREVAVFIEPASINE
jgi:hypothetical protein